MGIWSMYVVPHVYRVRAWRWYGSTRESTYRMYVPYIMDMKMAPFNLLKCDMDKNTSTILMLSKIEAHDLRFTR